MFIVFEGLDGSGSTTQAQQLTKRLEAHGKAVFKTKEPTNGTPIGTQIRDVLQHKWEASPEGLQLLFCADRAEHLRNEIEPALSNNKVVVCDRYLLSTIAYGSLAVKDVNWLKTLNKYFREPDLTFYLKLSPEVCLERIRGRGSEFELFEKNEKLTKIGEAYAQLSNEYTNVYVIDATQSIEEVEEEVWKVVDKNI